MGVPPFPLPFRVRTVAAAAAAAHLDGVGDAQSNHTRTSWTVCGAVRFVQPVGAVFFFSRILELGDAYFSTQHYVFPGTRYQLCIT